MPNVRIKRLWRASIQSPASAELRNAPVLWHKENLIGIRILHFGARRESFHIDVFARGIRALHQVRFARDRNSVWIISFSHLCLRRSWGRRWRCCLRRGRTRGLDRAVRVVWLLRRWVFLRLGGSVICRPVMLSRRRRWLLSA